MAVDAAALKRMVNSGPSDDETIAECLGFGQSVVDTFTVRVPAGKIPDPILDEAVLAAASDQFQRRKAPNGVLNQVYDTGDTLMPVRISRDPFDSVRPILAPWVPKRGLRTARLVVGSDDE